MARESKRTRDEKRFGRGSTLADLVIASTNRREWSLPSWGITGIRKETFDHYWNTIKCIQRALLGCKIIDGSNVARVYWDSPKDVWVKEDFPSLAPPFTTFFVETPNPGSFVGVGGKIITFGADVPDRWGALFVYRDCEEDEPFPIENQICDGIDTAFLGSRWTSIIYHVYETKGRPYFSPIVGFMAVGSNGLMLRWPTVMGGGLIEEEMKDLVGEVWSAMMKPIFCAISFMHCKNVVLSEIVPDSKISCNRR
jgi:hypothetical protein